eukprot:2757901-Lingulodinium_polyedra.AAC.1
MWEAFDSVPPESFLSRGSFIVRGGWHEAIGTADACLWQVSQAPGCHGCSSTSLLKRRKLDRRAAVRR